DPVRRHRGLGELCPRGDEPRPAPGARAGSGSRQRSRVGDPGAGIGRSQGRLDPRRDADSAQRLPAAQEAPGLRIAASPRTPLRGAVLEATDEESMGIDLTGMVRPHVVEMTKLEDNPNIAEFLLQPLERGFGHTLGNALRRMLLSSLSGSAVWGFRLDGVLHEHQTVQGVLEDVHQIVRRLKSLTLVLADGVDEAVLRIKKQGPGPVTAGDIIDSGEAQVISPD